MPFTYVSHQAPAVLLKAWRPRWFNGTALVTGSMSPDWAYALTGSRFAVNGHAWLGMVGFSLPAAVLAALLVRPAMPAAVGAVPARARAAVADLGLVAGHRPGLLVTVTSAAVGVLSHVGWDLFTHDSRWGAEQLAVLRETVFTLGGVPWSLANVLQQVSTAVGAVVTLTVLALLLRRGTLRSWYGGPPLAEPAQGQPERPSQSRPGVVRAGVVAGSAVGLWWALAGDVGPLGAAAQVNRAALGLAAGLLAGALAGSWGDRNWGDKHA